MGRAIGSIIVGAILVILGASGQFVLKGTNSSIALIIFGAILAVVGIGLAIGQNNKSKKKNISQEEINNIVEEGKTLIFPILTIWNNISGKSYNLYIYENGIIIDVSLKEAEVRYDKFMPNVILGFSRNNFIVNEDTLLNVKLTGGPKLEIVTKQNKIKGAFKNVDVGKLGSALDIALKGKLERFDCVWVRYPFYPLKLLEATRQYEKVRMTEKFSTQEDNNVSKCF